MYVDGDGPTEVTFSLLAGEYVLRWVDVTSGVVKDEVRFKHGGGEKMVRSPEFRGGMAMRMKKGSW
jgi:hypothetical protein